MRIVCHDNLIEAGWTHALLRHVDDEMRICSDAVAVTVAPRHITQYGMSDWF